MSRRVWPVRTIWGILLILLAGAPGAATAASDDMTRSLSVGGLKRSYLVHIPATYNPGKPTPVVLAFHGGGSNAQGMVTFSGLNDKADEAGFIVVYPDGTGRVNGVFTFNAGNCCASAMLQRVDDVEFVRRVLDDLGKSVSVDPRRVFATGMSNGAMMAYRLGAELSDRIAAVAPSPDQWGPRPSAPNAPSR